MSVADRLAKALRALRHHRTQTELYFAQVDADEALAEYDNECIRCEPGALQPCGQECPVKRKDNT